MIFRSSKRAKHIRISVHRDGEVIVTFPHRLSEEKAKQFALDHTEWIEKKSKMMKEKQKKKIPLIGEMNFENSKKKALEYATKLTEEMNKYYGFTYKKISIRNQKTRWGSCSAKGNLNFNYKILFLPKPLAQYLVVHELCHLKEMNHGKRFWSLVEETIKDWKTIRKEFKNI